MGTPGSRQISTLVDAASSERFGCRVRELRQARGLSLDGLQELSGVSRAMLSKMERGEKNPTLVVAAKVAEGLGVTLSQLVDVGERRRVVVVPKERRMVMRDPETGFERQLLSPTFEHKGVEFIRNVIPVGSTSGEFPPHREGVEEYIVVEFGTLLAMLDGEEYLLHAGDAIYFEADIPHSFANAGEGECSYFLVISSGRA